MQFLCPFCNFAITVTEDARGTRTVCDSCRKQVLVPPGKFDEGCVIGDFAILNKLGEGAIGAVYRAYQISLKREVALKILSEKHSGTEKDRQDFMTEARTAAKLNHNNLVQSYAVGEADNVFYMAMTYIHGESLRTRIRREGAIPCDEALHIVQQVAEALHYAWTESRLIHRDIKPDNIMIADKGVVKLTDLGLAIHQAEWREDMDISGSPSYMSPEQFAGEKLDTRSDIYSLGVTLYQMLSGELPYDAETLKSIAKQHFEDKVPDVGKRAQVPPSVARLVKKMMAKLPEQRFVNMDALLREIWKIRQETAPDQSYVPDIHTISMRRLDYEMQNMAAQAMAAANAKRNREKPAEKTQSSAVWLLTVLLMVVTVVLSVLLMKKNSAGDSGKYAELRKRENDVTMFEILAGDQTLPAGELELEAERIMKKLDSGDYGSVRERALQSHILQIIKSRTTQMETARTATENEVLKGELQELENEKKQLLAALEEANAKLISAEFASAERESALKELSDLRTQVREMADALTEQKQNHAAENTALVAGLKSFYTALAAECWEKSLFDECAALLEDSKNRFPCLAEFAENMTRLNSTGKNIMHAFRNGRTEYAKQRFGNATVSHLQNGVVYSFGADGESLTATPWDQLTKDEAWAILSAKPDLFPSETMTCAMFEVLRGKWGVASILAPNPFEEYAMYLAAYQTAWGLRALPPEEAVSRFRKYQQQLTGSITATGMLNSLKLPGLEPESAKTEATDTKNADPESDNSRKEIQDELLHDPL